MRYDSTAFANESGPATYTYNLAGEILVMTHNWNPVTHSYDLNGNLIGVTRVNAAPVTMSYDKENRLSVHTYGSSVVTSTYSGDGLKRSEIETDSENDSSTFAITTLVWDGSEYLAETEK